MMPTQVTVGVSYANTHQGAGDLNDSAVEPLAAQSIGRRGPEALILAPNATKKDLMANCRFLRLPHAPPDRRTCQHDRQRA